MLFRSVFSILAVESWEFDGDDTQPQRLKDPSPPEEGTETSEGKSKSFSRSILPVSFIPHCRIILQRFFLLRVIIAILRLRDGTVLKPGRR